MKKSNKEFCSEPRPGTYAFTARLLYQSGLMTGEEADWWKDEMKERDLFDEEVQENNGSHSLSGDSKGL